MGGLYFFWTWVLTQGFPETPLWLECWGLPGHRMSEGGPELQPLNLSAVWAALFVPNLVPHQRMIEEFKGVGLYISFQL